MGWICQRLEIGNGKTNNSSILAVGFVWIEPARPYLIGISIAVLVFAWYIKLKPAKTNAMDLNCETTKETSFRQSNFFMYNNSVCYFNEME